MISRVITTGKSWAIPAGGRGVTKTEQTKNPKGERKQSGPSFLAPHKKRPKAKGREKASAYQAESGSQKKLGPKGTSKSGDMGKAKEIPAVAGR